MSAMMNGDVAAFERSGNLHSGSCKKACVDKGKEVGE